MFICGLVHSGVYALSSHWDLTAETAGLERPPTLLATGVTPWWLWIQIGRRNYIYWYGAYFDGTESNQRQQQDAYLIHMTDTPWREAPSNGASATAPPYNVHPLIIPWDLQHPRRMGLRACVDHLGGTAWWLWRHASEGYQDPRPGLLVQQIGIRLGVFTVNHCACWQKSGGKWYWLSETGPRVGLCSWRASMVWTGWAAGSFLAANWPWLVVHTSPLHPGALTWLRGGPGTLPVPGSHSARGTQRQHWPIPETSQLACCWAADGIQAGGPPPPLSAALAIPLPEDVV